jgi:biotin-(acetyl-CoA carboxylase) ligase
MLLEYHDSIASTSSLLRDAASAGLLALPTLVCTDEQHAGRGTRGRDWQMQPGRDIAFSIGLPLRDGLLPSPRLPLALSVLVAQGLANQIREQWASATLQTATGPGSRRPSVTGEAVLQAFSEARDKLASRICAVKWPNDLLLACQAANGELEYRKCGGILVEQTSQALLIGIGINVNSRAGDFGPELAGRLHTLRDCCGFELDRETLFTGLAMRLYGHLVFSGILNGFSSVDDSSISALESQWRELDRTAGQQWLLRREGIERSVTATRVDFATGCLHVQDAAGEEFVVSGYSELTSL